MSKNFYITTTLPYVNALPHVGFAMEIIRADVIARYKRSLGYEVFFNTGTDEHGAKIHEAAQKEGIDTQKYVDGFAEKFKELKTLLNVTPDVFTRTTDENHILSAQEFWRRCDNNGDIYKKLYKTKYCVGCELEKTDSELVDGVCPIHPNRDIEIIEEENYFFRWSKYQEPLLNFYKSNPDFVIPSFRFNETISFVERGLLDFPISRLKTKMPWGIPVPNDDDHVMYVWFDALVNYISTLGWPNNKDFFEKFWINGTPIQYCGKDNNRQQSAMWQGMLMSAGVPQTKHIIIDGFINSGGQKMSKSLGNVISPFEVIDIFRPYTQFPEDVLRFVLLHDIPSFEDGDMTMESIKLSYKNYFVNGIGNLTSRIMTLSEKYLDTINIIDRETYKTLHSHIESFDLHKAISFIFATVSVLDMQIQQKEAFKVIKQDEETGKKYIQEHVQNLFEIASMLENFLPNTANKIKECIENNKKPENPLFARLP